jgi:hypothetical protein
MALGGDNLCANLAAHLLPRLQYPLDGNDACHHGAHLRHAAVNLEPRAPGLIDGGKLLAQGCSISFVEECCNRGGIGFVA